MSSIQPHSSPFLNLGCQESFPINALLHSILTPSHFYSEVFMDLMHRHQYQIGVDCSGISWFFVPLPKGHPGIYSCNSKEYGTFRSF